MSLQGDQTKTITFSEIKKFQKYYLEQTSLLDYQISRHLERPIVSYIDVILIAIIEILAAIMINSGLLNLCLTNITYIIVCSLINILLLELLPRIIGIFAIKCYQHYASEETRRRCLCVPSCSEYSIICLKKYELIHALLKIRKRLFKTCKGHRYVIDNP